MYDDIGFRERRDWIWVWVDAKHKYRNNPYHENKHDAE
jgi:hypothetical protein